MASEPHHGWRLPHPRRRNRAKPPGCGVARRLLDEGSMRFVLLCFAAACTSSSGGVSGMTPGGSFSPGATVSAAVMVPDGAGGSSGEALVVISSSDSACADAGAMPPIQRKNSRFISIELLDVNGGASTTPAAAGTYTIYPNTGSQPPKEALLETVGLDNTCQPVDADAASGQSDTVTLTSVTGGVFKGTFDVTLNTGDHLTGSFDPTGCPALQSVAAQTQTACD